MPAFLFLRMVLNALDGMIANETNCKSAMGSVLNELCDVVSDLALFSAFALILPISLWIWWLLIILCLMSEFIALAVYQASGIRPYSGPLGKSDRALFLGLLAILLLFFPDVVNLYYTYLATGIALAVLTIWNRLKIVTLHQV